MPHMQQQIYVPSHSPYVPSGMGIFPAPLVALNGATGSATHSHSSAHTSPRRRSSINSYPLSIHDPSRSPTRTRFNGTHASHTTDSSHNSAIGPERHNRSYGRPPQDENTYGSTMRSPPKPNFVSSGPCNHLLVPQGIFVEPASSRLHHFRYSDIVFKLAGFPDRGVKISSILNPRPALLEGWDEPILKDVTERELKVQIMWPGYKPFEKRVKTQRGALSRSDLINRLASMVVDFACNIKQTREKVEAGQERWTLAPEPAIGSFLPSDVFITKFYHCGGCHWQIELWVPVQNF